VSIDPVVPVPQTRRSDWNLPEDAFVFGYFCRLGRISKRLIETFAKILRQTPNGVLWIRNTPQIAVLRVKKFLLANGIEKKRVITACDVPNEEHRERLKHADLCLDSDIYGGHTTASDSLLSGVPYLALVGIWWHGRVSYSLIIND
jgi:predicted O-linked N-acetylglucosamine transferase (SPINDLY family)